jgi:hypothetical protein
MRRPPPRFSKLMIDELHALPVRERYVPGRTAGSKMLVSEWVLWPEPDAAWSPPAWLRMTGVSFERRQINTDAIRAFTAEFRKIGKAIAAFGTSPEIDRQVVFVAEIHCTTEKSVIMSREAILIPENHSDWAILRFSWALIPWYLRWVSGDKRAVSVPFDHDGDFDGLPANEQGAEPDDRGENDDEQAGPNGRVGQ